MIYKLIYTLSVLGLILNASPASADQRGEDKEVKSLTTSMQRLFYGEEESWDERQEATRDENREDSGDEDSEVNWDEDEHVEGLTIVVGRMVLEEEESGGYDVSSEAPSEGSEDVDGEGTDESAQASLPQPDLSNMGQENLDPSMNSARYVGSEVLLPASDPRFSDTPGSVEYMSAGRTAEGDDLWLRTPPRSARSYATSSGSRSHVSARNPGTSAPLFRSSARVRPISEARRNRISSSSALANLLAPTPAGQLFDESDYPDEFNFGKKPN